MTHRLQDDLRQGLGAIAQVVDALDQLDEAVTSVAGKADRALGHLAEPETVIRIGVAAASAAVHAVAHEAHVGAMRPRPPSSVSPSRSAAKTITETSCRRHGTLPWKWTIGCKVCGLVSQVGDPHAPRFLHAVCSCGAIVTERCEPICSSCYPEIVAHGGRMAPG